MVMFRRHCLRYPPGELSVCLLGQRAFSEKMRRIVIAGQAFLNKMRNACYGNCKSCKISAAQEMLDISAACPWRMQEFVSEVETSSVRETSGRELSQSYP